MDLEHAGKVVLVTGGTKGIGFACVRAFLEEGAKVAIVSRSPQNVDHALAEFHNVFGLAADLSVEEEAQRVIERVEDELGPIDVLVNSAGAAQHTPPDELSPTAYRAAMDGKFYSYTNVIDPVVKRMALRRSGVIVSVIGKGGKIANPMHIPGGAANAALMLVTAGLANAYAGRGVRIVAVNPGSTNTERVALGVTAAARHNAISEMEARDRNLARIPMGRMADPEEIAAMILFLASNKASYVTGVSISMDGAASSVIF